ncbi:SDR family NAD(P)-dependent oxidoreductase [Liquorilactobacillus sicerae]|uniref:SDR family NAD(P)-dependent oxidoreductase n=1 Tax=Liquorilactobacillus sicerae TaxID=1416943 RepID=UPI002480C0A0|nr:SDR family NAD(P)-dependent oxidoreductase [Liquorilactobacillus sicerae]
MITGGAQGIGAEIARHLAKDGFDVALADLPQQEIKTQAVIQEIETADQMGIFVKLGVTNQAKFKAAVDEVAQKLGGFDILVNNAGIAKVDQILDIKPKDLELSYQVNVFGVLYGIQAAGKKFKELNVPGKIINASSIAGMRAFPAWATYSSTKAAVISLNQAAAKGLAPDCIKFNALPPELWVKLECGMRLIVRCQISTANR